MIKENRRRRWHAVLAGVLAAVIVGACGISASAYTSFYQQPTVHTRDRFAYREVPMTVSTDDHTWQGDMQARLISGTTYVPLRAFCEAMATVKGTPKDLQISFSAVKRSATVKTSDLVMTVTDGSRLVTANGRYFYHAYPAVILDDDRLYLPVRILEKVYGVKVIWNASARSVTVKGKPQMLENGRTYYREDEVYWLARIISAESRGEPFLGQIAVGNVVLNRVRSKSYPNTIYGVIFDSRFGTQFQPTANGAIYLQPTESAVLAAKICLEGYSISDSMLYFYEPSAAHSHWIANNRDYLFNIGAHRFYD